MTNNNQYPLCHEHNNHPKEDLAFCKRCELHNDCHVFQEYLQPPWVKDETGHERMADSNLRVVRAAKLSAICDKCRHYHGHAKCDAFPEKVPTKIMLAMFLMFIHMKMIRGFGLNQCIPEMKNVKVRRKRDSENRRANTI